ncbi:cyclic AMP-dependent transcription factor ATF-3 isoform X1 [Silurus meridionalis]|nr:cyclic AMP-dependent transcription factor ATF-3 isoform X1 [Silurus meridionalis]
MKNLLINPQEHLNSESVGVCRVSAGFQNDASTSRFGSGSWYWSGSFGDQCVGSGAVSVAARVAHARRLHSFQPVGEGRAEVRYPQQTPVRRNEFVQHELLRLTTEEVDRRKRRRERNKIAAAKCRNKKKEKTDCLQKESEKLESVNAELKAQIEELKNQKQQLVYMLNLHRPTCIVRAHNGQTPEDERNLFIQQIKETTLQCMSFTTADSVDPVLLDVCEGPHL